MLRHIAWFNEAAIAPDAEGSLQSEDARVHRRCIDPACALEDRGVACSVFGNLHNADPAEVGTLLQKMRTDIVVIGPFSDPSLLKLARTAKRLGCYIVADFGDQTAISDDFAKLAALADRLVAGTPEALRLLESASHAATLIPDVNDRNAAALVAEAWHDCFTALKMTPPTCANSNQPSPDHG